jgi:hypothetical protein
MNKLPSLNEFKVLELLGLYSGIIEELCQRKILRTINNPAADYAEFLVCKALSLTPAKKSTKGYDAIDDLGNKYEIKARRLTHRSNPARFSAIRSIEEDHFTHLVAVLFTEDFQVSKAMIFLKDFVREKSFHQRHVNAWILPINENLWRSKDGEDITSKLKEIQRNMDKSIN